MYRIGELASISGVSTDTLRYYEKHGLLIPSSRNNAGYRYYSEDAVEQIAFIKRAKAVGFSLEDIFELLSLKVEKDSHSCQEVKDIAEAKLAGINAKLAELQRIQSALQGMVSACCGGPEAATHCSILEALESNTPAGEVK